MHNFTHDLEALSPERRKLIELLLKAEGQNAQSQPTLNPVTETSAEARPLSYAQERLWFLDQLQPGSSTYNLIFAMRLSGPLNKVALQQSLNEVVRRHSILRTTFVTAHDQGAQVIGPVKPVPFAEIDYRDRPIANRDEAVEALLVAEARQAIDLTRGPLLRAGLIQLDHETHVLFLITHHIVTDGWSTGVMLQEIGISYAAFAKGISPSLPPLPWQYADFAVWQREWLQGERLETQLAYWRQQLAGAPGVLNLLTDHPRPAIQTFQGVSQSLTLSKELSQALLMLSRQENMTLFMLLLAAFQTLLYRYTAQEDMVIGTPIAGRTRQELEGLIGFFANTLVLRTDLSGNPTFQEVLKRARKVALGAYAHQDLPFEYLVELLKPQRDLSYNPLFQVMFIFQNAPLPAVKRGELTLRSLHIDSGAAGFDLTLMMKETESGLTSAVNYNTDLFEAATIQRMLGHFQTLLEGIVVDPSQRLADLPLLTEVERHQLLVEWNDTASAYSNDLCLHDLFQAQVDRTPEAVAVVFGDQHLTYRELNGRANQLAHYLLKRGLRPEAPVGICMERSAEMLIGLLGILKAGGAYVPLDPTYPPARLSFMLQDSQAPVLLTQSQLVDQLPAPHSMVICQDADGGAIAGESPTDPSPRTCAEQLAYMIYTSGSTGQPKGVQILHRGVVNLLESMRRQPGLTASDMLLSVTTLSFDIAGLELFLPLVVGARVVLASRAIAADGHQLRNMLEVHQATVMQATPATWRLLLAANWPGQTGLKILCGGEALSLELAAQLLKRGASLWNLYGPTETTIWSCRQRITTEGDPIAIGRPLANTTVFVLDEHGQIVPIGVPGELYIGGPGLARGYGQRPDLTAEKFVPHAFSEEPGARLYRTGDLCRYRTDGTLEFLGRIDHQVKIRGFRIELGEIEAALGQHPAVRQAVALAREDQPGDKQLVAYVVSGQDSAPTTNELRRFLQGKLPDYMVPATFIVLAQLPLTPNGKVDRRALPSLERTRSNLEEAFVAPRTLAEEKVASIWAEVLRLEHVGTHDNFFNLGGHSLLAVQVLSRLREEFQIEIPLSKLFERPTVSELAGLIEQLHPAGLNIPGPALEPVTLENQPALDFEQLSDQEMTALLNKLLS